MSSHDGDLSASSRRIRSDPLFAFPINEMTPVNNDEGPTMKLPHILDLNVGEVGVIGRRVSIVAGREVIGARTIAEGIVGWN